MAAQDSLLIPAPRLPVPDPDFDDPKEVYAFYGLAGYAAQVLEQGLVTWVVALRMAGEQRLTTIMVERLFDEFEERTFGQLLRIVRERVQVSSDFEGLLEKALQRRNFLVHKFFSTHSADFLSDAGRRVMIKELRDAVALFEQADKAAESIYFPLLSRLGVSEAIMEQQMATFLHEARARDAAT